MTLSLGFSPCPNDTFIFDALVNGKIDTGGLKFEVWLEDVQTLNLWARQGKLDISKISYGVLPRILEQYCVLQAGGALGYGVGPLLISADPVTKDKNAIHKMVEESLVAIPGEDTTAHFLFTRAYPNAGNKVFLRFDEIESFVAAGKGLGVIIHENRFTYAAKGLHKVQDLGNYWEEATGNPIPLGGIVVKRAIPATLQLKVDALIRESVAFAFTKYPFLPEYVQQHAQEMSETVMRQHIDLYVNDFSLNVGTGGRAAIVQLASTLTGKSVDEGEIFAS